MKMMMRLKWVVLGEMEIGIMLGGATCLCWIVLVGLRLGF